LIYQEKEMAKITRGKSAIILTGLLLTVIASPVFGGIRFSKHDFSATNTSNTPFAGVWEVPGPGGFNLVIDEVCVFCHTPHGASKNMPGITDVPGGKPMWLWNRTNPSGYTYNVYSSSTFSNFGNTGPTGISLMCMSCHDGVTSIAVNTLLNPPFGASSNQVIPVGIDAPGAIGNIYNGTPFVGWGPNIGDNYPGSGSTTINLSNDHPISFDWPSGITGLKAAPSDARLRLFGPSKNRMECSTCHLVHDPTIVPFLAMPNNDSNMCRACHDK